MRYKNKIKCKVSGCVTSMEFPSPLVIPIKCQTFSFPLMIWYKQARTPNQRGQNVSYKYKHL